ncbi:MAG: hypothetical protein H0W30_19575 [Gemmatimonadaceae bacterium]|nr:hypothetical protein [Gemmatimonadaceae bacterium]
MNDPQVIGAIVIAVVVIAVFIILRSRITGFRGRLTRKGVDVDVKAALPEVPPAIGVDLSGSKFKDDNKFAADNEARVKAQNLQAGSGNEFQFGSPAKPAQDKKPKN